MKRKLQNSGVSKQMGHELFAPFPDIVLVTFEFFSHSSSLKSGEAVLEALIMQR
jgi:hypothetical protein